MSKPLFAVMMSIVLVFAYEPVGFLVQRSTQAGELKSSRASPDTSLKTADAPNAGKTGPEEDGRDYLRAMKEPFMGDLAAKDRFAVVYRFIWLPTFHNPIAVRYVKSEDGVVVHTVRLNGQGGYDPRNIIYRETMKRSPTHWKIIANQIEKSKFWTTPSLVPNRLLHDGHTLIVEGVSEGNYHVVYRDNPLPGRFVDLCQAMLFMSGIDVRKRWFQYLEVSAVQLLLPIWQTVITS